MPTTKTKPMGMLDAVGNNPVEEQLPQVKEYISNGMQLIHSDKLSGEIIKRLKGDNDIAALGDLTLKIIETLDNVMQSKNKKVNDEVKWKGATVFMSQLVEVGRAAKVLKIDDEGIKEAAGMAVGQYMQNGVANGTITEDQLKESYNIIKANNPGETVLFDPAQTPGKEESATPIAKTGGVLAGSTPVPATSPGPTMGGNV